jgi:hypothetical protein
MTPPALLAAHPFASLSDLAESINERLNSGYLAGGFADVQIETTLDLENKRLVATVDEGVRYHNGSLRIENAKAIDVAQLVERLTLPFRASTAVLPQIDGATGDVVRWLDKDGKAVENEKPVWEEGIPVRMDSVAAGNFRDQVTRALEDLAFRDAKFELTLVPNRKTQHVDLVVQIKEEGAPAKLEAIDVLGNQRDSEEAILEYLKLSPGDLLTSQRVSQIRYDLWRSGRYLTAEVGIRPPFRWSTGHALTVTVRESPLAPPIGAALTREEEALMKMGRMAVREDLTFDLKSPFVDVSAVAAQRGGASFTVGRPGADNDQVTALISSPVRGDRHHIKGDRSNAGHPRQRIPAKFGPSDK